MSLTTFAQAPSFHALTGAQPVGHTQVAAVGQYAGTITSVTRHNVEYWSVTVRSAVDAFRPAKRDQGKTVQIWRDATTGEFVADYWDLSMVVEVDRCRSLQAAIGMAESAASFRWAAAARG